MIESIRDLALRYAEVWEKLMKYTATPPETLHIVGGGCQDNPVNGHGTVFGCDEVKGFCRIHCSFPL